jgi:DNA invertase Pin-like site-specific DNA recombinase
VFRGLNDRLRQPTAPEVIERIESLRRQRLPGKEIAATVGVSAATVSRVLSAWVSTS